MINNLTVQTIAVGIDVHKYGHVAAACTLLNHDLGVLEFNNQTIDKLTGWLTQLTQVKADLLIGLEDIDSYGQYLAKQLIKAGYCVRYVPAKLTDRERKHSSHKDKTDSLDAKRVAKVMIQKLEETLPADLIVTDQQRQLKTLDLILQERDSLVRDQTELKNQLHALLHQHYGDNYRQGFKNPFGSKAIEWYLTDFANNANYLTEAIKRRLERLQLAMGQIKQLSQSVKTLSCQVKAVKALIDIKGCGELTASQIVVEIKNIKRFESEGKLARYGGFAPVTHSSGRRGRMYTDRGGNRKLNLAIHRIALSQIGVRKTEEAIKYYQKKLNEGKSKLWALRCLKRQILKRIFKILIQDAVLFSC